MAEKLYHVRCGRVLFTIEQLNEGTMALACRCGAGSPIVVPDLNDGVHTRSLPGSLAVLLAKTATGAKPPFHRAARLPPHLEFYLGMADFDCPENAFAAPRRVSTTTPIQALTLMNHAFSLDMTRFLAERLVRDAGESPEARVRRAFALAVARDPDAEEVEAAVRLVEAHGLRAFCRALINSNEFLYLED